MNNKINTKVQVAKGAINKIAKALNEELKQVTYVAMLPGVDLHGDEVDLETIRSAKGIKPKVKAQLKLQAVEILLVPITRTLARTPYKPLLVPQATQVYLR